jgi:crotonobetainyl-CoA:carnitine CoA-transferase CaiB-like acyl-CoA transferase
VEHPLLGPVRALSSPLRLSKTPPQVRRGAPVFGEHTAQVLGSLGYPAEEVSALQAAGAVYDPALPPPASPAPPRPAGGTDA